MVSGVDGLSMAPTTYRTDEGLVYDTATGVYAFPLGYEFYLRIYDLDGTPLLRDAFFTVVPSTATGSVSEGAAPARPIVEVASNEQFRVRYDLERAGTLLGSMSVSIGFFSERMPKIAAEFMPNAVDPASLSIVWVLPIDGGALETLDGFVLPITGIAGVQAVSLPERRVRVRLPEPGRRPFLLDWSDAGVNATVWAEPMWLGKAALGAMLQVRFQPGVMKIDPAGGTWMKSSFAEATAYSPGRKIFQHNGIYWAFWYDDYIKYSWSSDGITWKTPSLVPSSNDARIGFDVAMLGSSVGIAYVDEPATSLKYIEGRALYQAVSWNSPTTVAGCVCTLKIPSIAMSPLSGIFIALTYIEGSFSKFQVNRKDWSSTSWPAGPDFVEQYSGTGGYTTPVIVSSTNGTAYAFVFGTALDRFYWRWYGPAGWTNLVSSAAGLMTPGYPRENKVSVLVSPNDEIHITYVDTSGSTKTLERIKVQGSGTFGAESVYSTTATMVYPTTSIDLNLDVHLFWVTTAGGFSNISYMRQNHSGWIGPTFPFALTSATDPAWLTSVPRAQSDLVLAWTRDDGALWAVDAGILPLPSSIGPATFEPWARSGLSPYQSYFGQLADYVNPGTGMLTVKQDDLMLPGRGLDLSVSRVYQEPQTFIAGSPYLYEPTPYGSVGLGWSLNFPWIGPSFVHLWNGQTVYVDWDSAGSTFVYKGAEGFKLVKTANGYTLYAKSGSRYEFNTAGRVTQIVDTTGSNTINFTLMADGRIDLITDTVGRVVDFAYDVSNRVQTVTSGTRTVTYTYTTANQLATVADPATPTNRITSFAYRGTTGKDAYLLTRVTYPTAGYTSYGYETTNPIKVGTEALSHPINLHEVYLPSGKVRAASYTYEAFQGRIQFTKLTQRDGANVVQGYTEYNFRKAGEYTTTTKFDANYVQVERTRSWYGPQGAPSQTDFFAGNSATPTHSSTVVFDDWGNQIAARDPLGHESFAAYANTATENSFRGPGDLRLASGGDGKLLYDSFDDFNMNDDWLEEGNGGDAAIDNTTYEPSVPSIKVESSTTLDQYRIARRNIASQASSFVFEARIRIGLPDGTNTGINYILGRGGTGGTSVRVYLAFRQTPFLEFSWYSSSTATWTKCSSYEPLKWYRVTVVATGTTYDAYLDGAKVCGGAAYYTAGAIDNLAFESLAWSYQARMWVDEVKVFKGHTITIKGLRVGQSAALLDPNGAVIAENRTTASAPDLTLWGYSEAGYTGSGLWQYFEFGADSLRIYSESRVLEYAAPFREFWGGSVFEYTRPVEVGALARVESGFGRWQTLLLDDFANRPAGNYVNAEDTWAWRNPAQKAPVAGTEFHGSPWKLATHQHYFDSANLGTPASGQFHIQYLRIEPDMFPAEVMLQFGSGGTWEHRAFWGSDHIMFGTPGTPSRRFMNGLVPYRPDEWVMLIVKTNDVATNGLALSGLAYTLYSGSALWDASALGDLNTGLVRVGSLAVGQKVELTDLAGVVKATHNVSGSDANTAKLDVYAGGISWFPYRAKFKVYATDGTTLQYVSPAIEVYGGDLFQYTPPDFYVGSVNADIHNRAVGNLAYRTTASLDPILHLDMENTVADGRLKDVSFSGNHGTKLGNMATSATSVVGAAMRLDGTGDGVQVKDAVSLDSNAELTIALWIRPEAYLEPATSNRALFVTKWNSGGQTPAGQFTFGFTGSDGKLVFTAGKDGSSAGYFLAGNAVIPLNAWSHVAAVFDRGAVTLYYNGAVDATGTISVTQMTSAEYANDDVFVGRLWNSAYEFTGSMDEVMLMDRSLSSDDIGILYRTQYHTGGHPEQKSFTKYTATGLSNQTKAFHNGQWITTYIRYDAYGNQIEVAGFGGRTTTYEYSTLYGSAYLTKITQPLGVVSNFSYDFATGMRTWERDPNGGDTDHTYDKLLRILTTRYPSVGGSRASIAYAYDDTSSVLSITDELGRKIKHYYDAIGRETKIERLNPDGSVYSSETLTYDWQDRVKTQTTATGSTYTTDYDPLGRVTKVTNPDSPNPPTPNLAPNGVGSPSQWTRSGCTANYECVDDATPDGDATYVTASTTGYADLYALPELTQSAAVVSVTVSAVAKGYPTGGCSNGFDCFGALRLRVNGYAGATRFVSDLIYESTSQTWSTNPATGLPWTTSEVNNLQAGVEKASLGVFSTPNTRVTQLYVTVQLVASFRTVAYDDANNAVTATDEVGRVVRYTYDRGNRLVKVEERNPATGLYNATETKYDGTGSVVSVKDPEALTTLHVYDDLGRLTVTVYPDAAKSYEKYTYDNGDNLVSKRKRDGVVISFQYNQLDRLTRVTYPGNYLVDYSYDKIGNTKKVVNANATLWYEYDARNRMTKESSDTTVVGGANDTTTYTYDAASNLATMTYPDGTVLTYVVDAFNRVGSVKSGTTTYASFTYRSDDRISTSSFGNAASTLYEYDVRARPTRLQTSTVVMRPNAAGDTTQWTKSGSGGTNWDRVDEAMPDDDTTYVKATAPGKIDKYNLQDYTLAAGETVTAVEVHAFARQTTATSNAQLKLRVNGAESAAVSLSTTYTEYAASWAVDPADGLAWTQTDINALQAGQTLSAIASGEARVTQVWVVLRTSKPLLELQYTYNAASDVTQLVATRSTSTWTEILSHDGQDRLRTWTASGSNAFSQTFSYTQAGDRTLMVEDGVTTWSYAYRDDHRLWYYNKTGFTGQLSYDANGNVVTRTTPTTYTYAYDAEDRLVVAKQGATVLGTYYYDGLGRRVKAVEGSTTTYFVYSGLSLAYTIGTTVTKYVYASGLLVARLSNAAPTVAYFHQDHLGSTRAVTDANRAIVFGTQYKPFGAEFGTTGTDAKLKFTGQHKDAATGLYYLFRRFYDPEIGRFLGQDRILGHLTVPQSLDRYAYVVNNPLRYVDPTGEFFWNPFAAIDALGKAAGVDVWGELGKVVASINPLEVLDMVMTVVGFIPGVDIISDAYFLGRAIVDVLSGKGSWEDVALAGLALAVPIGAGVFKAAKKFLNAADSLGDAGRAGRTGANGAEAVQDVGRADGVAKGAAKTDDPTPRGRPIDPGHEAKIRERGISGANIDEVMDSSHSRLVRSEGGKHMKALDLGAMRTDVDPALKGRGKAIVVVFEGPLKGKPQDQFVITAYPVSRYAKDL